MPLFTSTRSLPPYPESDAVKPNKPVPPLVPTPPGYIPMPLPKDARIVHTPETNKPLMILLVRDGADPEKLQRGLKAVGEALTSGGAVAIDTNYLDPLVLFYGGHVIRFDEYDTEAPEPSAPRQERQTPASERETW